MKSWKQLSAEQAHILYQVSKNVAYTVENVFYSDGSMPGDPYDDGPWSLIAFLDGENLKYKITVQVCAIEEDFLHFNDFDPLTEPFCGYIYLNKSYLTGFSRLLVEQSERIINKEQGNRNNFEPIDLSQYDDYHLRPKNHPKTFQFHWRLHDSDDNSIIRLVTISAGKVRGSYVNPNDQLRFLLEFREFPEFKLNDVQFTPLDEALSRITLNRNELVRLASIIEQTIDYYEDNPP
ncbi:MAG: hypothetical protein GY943_04335 [Chloroflexi bacterium]|nr:hypothetical protein [Chloroflexota bacterium]